MVAVVQREWAAKNPRATFRDPIHRRRHVLNSRMTAYPNRLLQCCSCHRWRGALIPTSRTPKGLPRQSRSTSSAPARAWRRRWSARWSSFTSLRGVPRLRQEGLRGKRHRAQGCRSPDDLRRLRASAALRPRRPRLLQAGRGRELHLGAQHRPGRQAAAQHQWRAASATCIPACTACTRCRRACGRCAASRRRRCRAPRSRSATASAACSPPRHHHHDERGVGDGGRKRGGIDQGRINRL